METLRFVGRATYEHICAEADVAPMSDEEIIAHVYVLLSTEATTEKSLPTWAWLLEDTNLTAAQRDSLLEHAELIAVKKAYADHIRLILATCRLGGIVVERSRARVARAVQANVPGDQSGQEGRRNDKREREPKGRGGATGSQGVRRDPYGARGRVGGCCDRAAVRDGE